MKFLNEIDGADKLVEDTGHRLVSDTEKENWNGKQNALTFDSTPKASSTNPVTSGGIKTALDGKVDNSRVLTDVPAGAKFTDTNTTYSEITTAEIDAGTASTLRTITGRRIKYILDKVGTMISTAISGLTKANVGLGNVDNIQQATKSEFNSHNADSTRHIISSERTKWNTVDNKVDKVTGKQLSTEDYSIAEKDKLSGIEVGANKYTHPSNHPYSILTGVPTKLSDFSKDINFDERYYTENETDTLLGDKTDKTYVNSELGKKQNSLGYTPVNKSGDTMTGQLRVESTTFPVIDITRNTSSTGGNLYGGARLQRKTTNPTNGVGIGFYFQAPNSNKTMTHAGMFGGALGTIQAGSEKGEIVFGSSYAGQDPYTRRDLVIRAISASKAEAELNGKLTADNTVYSDAPNTVTTKKYVDDGLDSKVNNSRVLTDVPVGAKFTDTNTTYSAISTSEIDAGISTTSRTITAQRLKYATDKVGITLGTTQPTSGWWFKEI